MKNYEVAWKINPHINSGNGIYCGEQGVKIILSFHLHYPRRMFVKLYWLLRNKLRSFWDYWYFVLEHKWIYILSVLGTVAGIASFLWKPPTLQELSLKEILYLLLCLLSLGGIVDLGINILRTINIEGDLYQVDINSSVLTDEKHLRMSETYKSSGYELAEWDNRFAHFSRIINSKLPQLSLSLKLNKKPFSFSEQMHDIAIFVLATYSKRGTILFNEAKVRLQSDITLELIMSIMNENRRRKFVILQKTNYFNGLLTNEMTLKQVWSRSKQIKLFDGIDFICEN